MEEGEGRGDEGIGDKGKELRERDGTPMVRS